MPIHHKRGILYSSLELSQIINVPQEKIDKFIGEEHFTRATKTDNLSYIEKDNLALFFDEFLSYLHIVPTYYKMHSYEMWKNFNQVINKPIDFLFIDGDHSIRGCMNDFALFYPHVSTGGYIVLHDIYPEYCGYKGPRYLIDRFVKKSSCFDVVEIKTRPYNFGMAIIQKIRRNTRFYPDVNFRLDIIRARANLQKTTVWQKIKDTPIGTVVRKIFK